MKSYIYKVTEKSYETINNFLHSEFHKCQSKECFVRNKDVQRCEKVDIEFVGKTMFLNKQEIDVKPTFDGEVVCTNIKFYSVVKIAKNIYIIGHCGQCSCKDNTIALDINSQKFITTSNNEVFDLVKTRKYIEKLNAKKILLENETNVEKIAKYKKHIQKAKGKIEANLIQEINEITNKLLLQNDVVYIEDLGLVNKDKFNYKINNYVYSYFRSVLVSKSHLLDKKIVLIENDFPSTKKCSECGKINDIDINYKTYCCDECHLEINRDLNAAKNILNRGEDIYEKSN